LHIAIIGFADKKKVWVGIFRDSIADVSFCNFDIFICDTVQHIDIKSK
jgi:hypothetical protein